MPSSRRPLVVLLRLVIVVVLASLSTAVTPLEIEVPHNQFTAVDCQSSSSSAAPSPSQSSTGNGKFEDNVDALLDILPSTAATTGFASLYQGEGTDRAFVRGLCRGDTGRSDCEICLVVAVLGISNRCNSSSRRAAIWYDKCSVSYADTNASTVHEQQYRSILYNVMNVSNKDAFESTYYALMNRLAQRVVNGSGTTMSSSLPVAPMFATGEALYDSDAPNGTMYGMLQCMRDRTAAECNQCLEDSIPQLPSCCYGHQGGVVLGYDCKLRVEIYTYYDLALDAPPPVAPAPSSFAGAGRGKTRTDMTLAVVFPVGTILLVAILLAVFWYKRKGRQTITRPDNTSNEEDIGYIEMDQLNLSVLTAATHNFGKDNKLGEGGFGEVFKGVLPDGEVIAVKRLSKHSSQGLHELKNELMLVAKLKHRNLVRLMGVCLQEEKLLVYEYMPNRSLDTVLFDPIKRQQLDWSKRFMIICGIARGLLYLHEESRLKVIHRDLKPSNVLLDADLNPKISDFGLARAFVRDQSRDVTIRPVGTLGYMSPEYAYFGHVSTKSDMFSFGVIILEMVTGRRSNSMSECPDSTSLLSHVWGNWKTGSVTDVVDVSLGALGQYPESEVLNCIEVGLLCVQENPDDRPDASSVVLMLTNPTCTADEGRLAPSRPAFVFGSDNNSTAGGRPPLISGASLMGSEQTSTEPVSKNDVTISEFKPR